MPCTGWHTNTECTQNAMYFIPTREMYEKTKNSTEDKKTSSKRNEKVIICIRRKGKEERRKKRSEKLANLVFLLYTTSLACSARSFYSFILLFFFLLSSLESRCSALYLLFLLLNLIPCTLYLLHNSLSFFSRRILQLCYAPYMSASRASRARERERE